MKKFISVILSMLVMIVFATNICAMAPEQRVVLADCNPVLSSKSIQEFEKALHDFSEKNPTKDTVKNKDQLENYNLIKGIRTLYLPKQFKNNDLKLQSIQIVGANGNHGYIACFEKDNLTFKYIWGEKSNETYYNSPDYQLQYEKTQVVNGITVNAEKYQNDSVRYHWELSNGSGLSLIVYGQDNDFFEYCDMYEYNLDINPEDISAGASSFENSISLI